MFEQTPRPLKVALLALFVVLLMVLVFIILTQKGLLGKKTETLTVPATTSQPQAKAPAVPPASPSPTALLKENAPKQIKDLQAQIDAGIITPEEAKKQLEAMNPKTAP